MLRKILSFLTVIALSIGFFSINNKTVSVKAESNDFDCNYRKTAASSPDNLGWYGASEIIHYTEEEAKAAGVPAGFSGDVLKPISINNSTQIGILLDFSHLNLPAKVVKSITFRVYVASDTNTADGYPEIRIPKPYYPNEWTMRYYDIKNHIAEWHDVVYTGSLLSLCTDGYLDKFELGLRHNNVTDFYIDSIKVNYVEDTTAPVITYNGKENVTISEGQQLNLNVSAYDAVQGDVEVEYIWADPSRLDENGNPLSGEHTLILRATDYFGNVAERTITVTVSTPDTTAPVINLPTESITVKTGTIPLISVEVYDDRDDITPTYTWSAGALDSKGRLTAGTHTLSIIASDYSGNTTTQKITFIVTDDGDTSDVIIDEEELSNKQEEGPDEPENSGGNETESTVESESEIESETESIVESESVAESETASQAESKNESIQASESTEEPAKKSGCGGAIATLPFLSLLALGGAAAFIRKRK